MHSAALYLIPVTLGDTPVDRVLPAYNNTIISGISHFIVENIRTARRFLKKSNPEINIDSLTFYTLNGHTRPEEVSDAQRAGYKVVPLVGPSSILMSLMASGFNGQSFAFHGYLPIDAGERARMLKNLEHRIYAENETQIFIETPYRNSRIIDDFIKTCNPLTKLCIAANITCEDEYIRTLTLKEWNKVKPDLGKKPCIFLLYK